MRSPIRASHQSGEFNHDGRRDAPAIFPRAIPQPVIRHGIGQEEQEETDLQQKRLPQPDA